MMDAVTVALLVIAALVFPGLLFLFVLSMLTEWWERKIVARAQARMGPSYVGPVGVLQPFADFIKLLSVKEEIRQKFATPGIAKAFAFAAIGALSATLLMLPLSPVRLAASYDIIVLSYICCVWVPFAVAVMGMSFPNPFTGAGVSRFLTLYAVCEPAFFAAILVPVALTTNVVGTPLPYSVLFTAQYSWKLWLNPATAVVMIIALGAAAVATQAKAMAHPFNIPEAEQELIAGHMTEFSGQILALNNLIHDADIAVSALLITYFFLGGPYPFPHLSVPGVILMIVKYVAVVTVVSIIKASFGRFRIEQGVAVLVKYSLIPAVIALLAAMFLSAYPVLAAGA